MCQTSPTHTWAHMPTVRVHMWGLIPYIVETPIAGVCEAGIDTLPHRTETAHESWDAMTMRKAHERRIPNHPARPYLDTRGPYG